MVTEHIGMMYSGKCISIYFILPIYIFSHVLFSVCFGNSTRNCSSTINFMINPEWQVLGGGRINKTGSHRSTNFRRATDHEHDT